MERQKELEALERDTRTVFAFNLSTRASDMEIFEFFSQAGTVMDVRIITDRNTKRSKGFAYIEMSTQSEVAAALALQGQPLLGQAVMVKASEAEKNMAWEAQQAQNQSAAHQSQKVEQNLTGVAGTAGFTGPAKLQVACIHPNVKDDDLRSIFEPFGTLDFAEISKDLAGNSTGTGFVQYSNMGDALRAVQELNNLEIAGLRLQVTVAPVTMVPPVAPGAFPGVFNGAFLGALPGAFPGVLPGLPGTFPGVLPGPPPVLPAPDTNVNDLDDDGAASLPPWLFPSDMT
jgi:RNA-binding protein 39